MLQKSLEIPKRLTEAVNRRRTENTMATTKRAKEQTVINKTPHRKPKIEQHERHSNLG